MSQEHVDSYDQFATAARRYGVELTAGSPGTVAGVAHERDLPGFQPTTFREWIEARVMEPLGPYVETGIDVPTGDSECCGTAGSSGYDEQHDEPTIDEGPTLEEQFRDADCDRVLTDGDSGTDQVGSLLGEEPTQVIERLAADGGTQ